VSPADRIRKAAFGIVCCDFADLMIGDEVAWRQVYHWIKHEDWRDATLVQRRMFLLFAAEAIEGAPLGET